MDKASLFYQLIDIFERHNLPYALVGRTETYPDAIGSDIDIVIPKNKIDLFHHIVWEIEKVPETKVIQCFQHETVAFYYIVVHFSENGPLFIQPDVCTDYYRRGRKLLTAEDLLEERRKSKQGTFYVLSSHKEFIYYLLKKIDKRNLSVEQFEHIRNSFLENPEKALLEAGNFFTKEALQVIERCLRDNDLDSMLKNLAFLQQSIHQSHRKAVIDVIKDGFLKLRRIMHPTGYVVAFLGPDGSGKTTVINAFKSNIAPSFRKMAQYHLFPVPQKDSDTPNTDPHQQKPRSPWLSFLKLCYFIVLYNTGWLRLVVPKKIRSTLVIFDRYYHDLLIDPLRYRNGCSAGLTRFVGKLLPQPQLWFVLDAPTDVIQARKSEVTPEETERQRNAYRAFAESRKNAFIIDTNRPVNVIAEEVCRHMSDALTERAHKRYQPKQ
ncbi:MAG: hypothetical protein IJT13_03450 [Bacteroidaceae bacterium]|nr:hypothetical protein [Bacteroidaceae bacterium]